MRMGQNSISQGLGGAFGGVSEYVNKSKAQYALEVYTPQMRIMAMIDQLELARVRSGCQ
jgi:hypothetical protein